METSHWYEKSGSAVGKGQNASTISGVPSTPTPGLPGTLPPPPPGLSGTPDGFGAAPLPGVPSAPLPAPGSTPTMVSQPPIPSALGGGAPAPLPGAKVAHIHMSTYLLKRAATAPAPKQPPAVPKQPTQPPKPPVSWSDRIRNGAADLADMLLPREEKIREVTGLHKRSS
jgi:hypothetical protein